MMIQGWSQRQRCIGRKTWVTGWIAIVALMLGVAGCSDSGLTWQPWGQQNVESDSSLPQGYSASTGGFNDNQLPPTIRSTQGQEYSSATQIPNTPTPDPRAQQVQQQVQNYVNQFPEGVASGAANPQAGLAAREGAQSENVVAMQPPNGQGLQPVVTPSANDASQTAMTTSPSPTTGSPNAETSPWITNVTLERSNIPEAGVSAIESPNHTASITSPTHTSQAAMASPSSTPSVQLTEVRPATADNMNALKRSDHPANRPAVRTTSSSSDLADTIRELEARVAKNPHQYDDLYKLRLLYAATGQKAKATAPVPGLDAAHAELLNAMLSVVTRGDQVLTQPSASSSQALMAVEELGRLLRQQTSVIIPKVALVTRVNSFGDYVAVDPPVFEQGKPVHVFVYTEIANFRSEPTADGRLRTVLSESIHVYDSSGKVVYEKSVPQFEDRTITPRRDFFYPFEIKLPADLPAGQYALKVTVEDKLSATTDQQRVTLTIR